MPQLVKKRRSGWAVLAAGALVASIFAVGAGPAAAIDDKSKQDHVTKATSCLGPAMADQGFTDIAGVSASARTAINCLAYYGISAGKTADTFDPNSNVSRSQMALFLYAAAQLMGVDLMGGDGDADFGDIADQGEARRNAITALARNGILPGRSGMTFDPDADITRAEMAVALVNLLDHTPGVGLSKATAGDNKGLFVFGSTPGTGDPPNDRFDDAYRTVPRHIDNAISAAYELGITAGTGDGTTFSPNAPVPRRNMAQFITAAMAHSNARPAGLTAQLIEGDITVSVRDADFKPVLNAHVDAFWAEVAHEARAFKADGTCSSRTTAVEGQTKCAIDGSDPVTQSDGNITLARVDPGEGRTAWVWTGDLNDKVGTSTNLFEMSIPKGTAPAVTAARAVVSNDLPKDPNAATPTDVMRARFGRTVTVTIQLKGASATDDADKDAKPANGAKIEYQVVTSIRSVDTTDNSVSDTAISQDTQTVTVDADGKATFTLTVPDPDARPGMFNTLAGRYAITIPAPGGTPAHALAIDPVESATGDIIFTDAAPMVSYVSIVNPGPQVAPGNASASAAVTIRVLDQYGNPFRGAPVYLHSNNPNTGATDTDGGSTIRIQALVTGSSGTVRMSYSYTGGARQDTLRAAWDGYRAAVGDTAAVGTQGVGAGWPNTQTVSGTFTDCEDAGAAGADVCGTTMVLWVLPSKEAMQAAVAVLSLDAENSQIVVDLQTGSVVTPTSVNFDSNDFFSVVSAANGGSTKYLSMADFVAALTKELATAKATTADDQPTLAWAGYVYDDSSNITSFTLTLGTGR